MQADASALAAASASLDAFTVATVSGGGGGSVLPPPSAAGAAVAAEPWDSLRAAAAAAADRLIDAAARALAERAVAAVWTPDAPPPPGGGDATSRHGAALASLIRAAAAAAAAVLPPASAARVSGAAATAAGAALWRVLARRGVGVPAFNAHALARLHADVAALAAAAEAGGGGAGAGPGLAPLAQLCHALATGRVRELVDGSGGGGDNTGGNSPSPYAALLARPDLPDVLAKYRDPPRGGRSAAGASARRDVEAVVRALRSGGSGSASREGSPDR